MDHQLIVVALTNTALLSFFVSDILIQSVLEEQYIKSFFVLVSLLFTVAEALKFITLLLGN